MQTIMAEKEHQLPQSLIDPISHELFTDPVIASDGHTYERSSILGWFKQCRQKEEPITSPITRKQMKTVLHDNIIVKQLIAELNPHPSSQVRKQHREIWRREVVNWCPRPG